ncbi:FAD-binding oxidoreductase [Blastococcus deserti]|uniref:FAD-binding oxidoreductase n=1 Tax=Blastococcus deserti TaxID=2259033 RepID=A0ABW4X6Y4_9ACTN
MTETLTSPDLITPDDPRYDQARQAWNLTVDQRPAAVALPRTPRDVAAVVRAAADAGHRVAVQGTGHNAGPLGPLDDVVLLRTTGMTGVVVNPGTRTARVAAGTVWLPVVQAAAEYGLAALHGSSPDVGVAGYSLGGGTGWYARALGLQTNALTAVELVTADGSLVRADARSEPDLFWAVRGGGGNFGAVTALEFRLHPVTSAYAGMLVWDRSRNSAVLGRWLQWALEAPDAVTTSYRVMHLPDVPMLPEPLRGWSVVVVDGAALGSDEQAAAVLAPLRELRPEIDTFTRVAAPALARLHMDPEGPTPTASATSMLTLARGSTAEIVDVVDEVAGADARSTVLMGLELRQLGGALGRPHPGGGALSRFDGDLIAFAGGMPLDEQTGRAMEAAAEDVMRALSPWASGRQYLNFVERPVDAAVGFDPAAWDRLRRIRAQADPGGLFLANHSIPPAH